MSERVPVPFLDLRRAYDLLRPGLDAAILRTLASGRYILSTEVEAFEREFAAYCGAEHCIGVASGTDALHLALRACEVAAGHEVITVANTCVPTVAAIEMTGAKATFCDIDPETLTMDPRRLSDCLTPRTRAIVPVHLYGRCADMDAIQAFAEAHGLIVVEDAAQAHGARHRGRRAGTLGRAAAFSFYPTKNLGGFGDGGAVTTDDGEIAERVRMLRNYGERNRYEHEIKGVNSRLDEVQAAILRVRLTHLDRDNERRREIAKQYRTGLTAAGVRIAHSRPCEGDAHHLFVIRVSHREVFQKRVLQLGVQTLIHYPRPVPLQPAYAEYRHCMESLEVTAVAAREVLSLPLFPAMTQLEIDAVLAACRDAARIL